MDGQITFFGVVLILLTGDAVVWLGGILAALAGLATEAAFGLFGGTAIGASLAMVSSVVALEVDRRRPRHRRLLHVGFRLAPSRVRALLLALGLVVVATLAIGTTLLRY